MFKILFALLPLFQLLRLAMGEDTGSTDDPPTKPNKPSELIEKYSGDAIKMADKLADVLNDNHSLREWKRTTAARLTELENKVPGDGAVVLKGDDLTRWQAYTELGSPDDLLTLRREHETLAQEIATRRKRDEIAQVAEIAGFKADVLQDIGATVTYEVREVDEQGKKVKKVFVKQDEQTTVPIEQHFQKLLPALKIDTPRRGDGVGSPLRATSSAAVPESAQPDGRRPLVKL